jgi:hypothetical protein
MRVLKGLPLLFFIAHVVESIQAPRNLDRPRVDVFDGHREGPARGVNPAVRRNCRVCHGHDRDLRRRTSFATSVQEFIKLDKEPNNAGRKKRWPWNMKPRPSESDSIVVDLKAIKILEDIHFVMVRSHPTAAPRQLGLLLNFAKTTLEPRPVSAS